MRRLASFLFSLLFLFACTIAPAEEQAPPALTTENLLVFLAERLEEVLCGEQDGLTISFTSLDGTTASGGFGLCGADFTTHFSTPEYALALGQGQICLTDDQGCVSLPLTQLISAFVEPAAGANVLAVLNSIDFTVLEPIAQELLLGLINCDGISYALGNQMLTLQIDLDKALQHINTLVATVLQHHAAALDALFSQLAPFIGEQITAAQLLAIWDSLQLSAIVTGLKLDAVLFQTGDVMTLIASCMSWSLKAELSDTNFSFALTAPDGTIYAFDTRDLLTIANIFGTVPEAISEEAFKLEEIREYNRSTGTDITTTNITVDLAMLEQDIKAGLTKAITTNQLTVDMLCEKYQPLVTLLTGGPRWTSSALMTQINNVDLLPDWIVACTAVMDNYEGILDVSASLAGDGEVYLLFDLHVDNVSLNASLRDPDGEFNLLLTGVIDRFNTTLTLSCSEDLGGFHSITYATSTSYANPYTSITTDSDIFHYTEDRYGFDLKVDEYELIFHLGRDYDAIRLRWPDGFMDYVVSDVGADLTSNYGSLSVRSTYDGLMVNGTIMDGYTPTHFSVVLDTENSLFTASVMPYRGDAVYLRYQPGRLSILADSSELVIADTHSTTPNQNVTTAAFDGETLLTLVSTIENGDLTMQLFPGATTQGDCWTLYLDFGAPGKALPADAVTVTAEEFITRLDAVLQPVQPEPQPTPIPFQEYTPPKSN